MHPSHRPRALSPRGRRCTIAEKLTDKKRDRRALRLRAAVRAAELMYFDGIKEYLRAKRKAARHIGHTLYPNNSEIRDQIDLLAELHEGPARLDRLLSLREAALEVMEQLEEFEPRLIGSVLTGFIKSTSDIDLHAFTDEHERVGEALLEAGHEVEFELVKTRKGGEFMDFPHYYVTLPAGPLEISVYPQDQLKKPQKSSITHRTMERATMSKLRRLIAEMKAGRASRPPGAELASAGRGPGRSPG